MADLLTKLAADATAFPQYKVLLDYLTARNQVPEIKSQYLGDEYGRFRYGGSLPSAGVIDIDSTGGTAGTLIHELTHAATRSLSYQSLDRNASKQFMDAYNKLQYDTSYGAKDRMKVAKMAELLAPGFIAKDPDYRGTTSELQAHAMGNMAGRTASPAPAHLDATLATELMILLDIATRDAAARSQSEKK